MLTPEEKDGLMQYREDQTWAFSMTIVVVLFFILAAFWPSQKRGIKNDLFRKSQAALRQ